MTSKTIERVVDTTKQCEEDIQLMAYYLWEEKGSHDGSDIEDWNEAEEYLNN